MTEKEQLAYWLRKAKKSEHNRRYHAANRARILERKCKRRAELREHREACQVLSGFAQLHALSKAYSK